MLVGVKLIAADRPLHIGDGARHGEIDQSGVRVSIRVLGVGDRSTAEYDRRPSAKAAATMGRARSW